ncbi:MAG: tRNA epoxyqueuosine(34) reductase QueG [Phycisphaerae bacterium]|nr:tRNA epoxyqueuosine(34) reductase QueG [Phycisphaerae bacterium]
MSRVGIAPAAPLPGATYYKSWLRRGYHAGMGYLARNVERRAAPASLLEGARSIICAALSYQSSSANRPHAETAPQAGPATGRVARYAHGRDYHLVLRERLETLVERLRQRLAEPFEARLFVDTGPLLERELAAAAGLGWIAKNTMLLSRELGSYTVLGEVLTTLELAHDAPETDHCGSCTRCLDACPTGAFPAPYQMDASRCISYLTIEHRGTVPPEFHPAIGEWVYGCDVCQEVCPFNDHAPAGDAELCAERAGARADLLRLLKLTPRQHRAWLDESAADRARPAMWRRNAAIALGNRRALDDAQRQALAQAAASDDLSVQQAAREALRRHGDQG